MAVVRAHPEPRAHRAPVESGPKALRLVDALSLWAARIAAVMICVIAAILAYEVAARYVFHAPTRWTSDVGTTLMIWLSFLAMAQSLRSDGMIRITAVIGNAPPALRRLSQAFTLLVIAGFSLMAVWLCWGAMVESFNMGRRQPTMLQMPEWIAEAPIIAGYACLALQALADLIRLPFRPAPVFVSSEEAELHALSEESR
ncbi:TRAP transporter small permease [Citreicella sp. C3M06]|uniref:TRAP transporter small permease subunit n=1 Tax=Citreicella sp. C3M06 TaxID=2841564 RepID=UPI001C0912D3|nr:TRAP transporter small permease [Citreicella sp. C3M06]MBU2960419.1 TRAP transporter small permease [Citreicella sp. C3M06]